MTVPLHWTASGLPVGDEATLPRLAGRLELAKPCKDRLPTLAA